MLRKTMFSFGSKLCNIARRFSITSNMRKIMSIKEAQKSVTISFMDEELHSFHYHWLRDHCRCEHCYNSAANERILNILQIPLQIKPKELSITDGNLRIKWPDGHMSSYDGNWLKQHHYGQTCHTFFGDNIDRVFWNQDIKDNIPPSIPFNDVLSNDESLFNVMKTVEKYGFCTVSSTPTNTEAMWKLAERFGFLNKNVYGDAIYCFTNQSTAEDLKDVAFLNVSLNSHHDGTFLIESPGVQSFHCHEHTGEGGETLLVDGINAAYQLKEKNIEAFNFLSTVSIPSLYKDPEFDMRNYDPIIKCNPISGEIHQVRINENHRDVLSCLKFEEIETFYEALHEFLTILRSTENEYWLKLTPGNCLILDNWRVLHGRSAFTGKRTICGFYTNKGDFFSKLRFLQKAHKSTD